MIDNKQLVKSDRSQKDLIHNHLKQWKQYPFIWGVYDCYTLIYDWVEKLYNHKNHLPNLRNRYSNREEALQFASQYNWISSLKKAGYLASIKKVQIDQISNIKDSDLVLLHDNELPCMHIYSGEYIWSMMEGLGLVRYPLRWLRLYISQKPDAIYQIKLK